MAAEENLNAARPVQVGAHSPEPLRVALEKTCDRFEAMAARNGDVRLGADAVLKAVRELLAAHPVEPVGVSDEAVEAAQAAWTAAYWKPEPARVDWMRAALTAALPHLQPQPVASRERVAEVLAGAVGEQSLLDGRDMRHPRSAHDVALTLEAALLAAGVFRLPPTREQLAEAIQHVYGGSLDVRKGSGAQQAADAVLNLLNGTGVDSTVNTCPGCGVKVIGHERCGDPTRPGCAS